MTHPCFDPDEPDTSETETETETATDHPADTDHDWLHHGSAQRPLEFGGYPSGYSPWSSLANSNIDEDDDEDDEDESMGRTATHVTIWQDQQSPAYPLKEATIANDGDHVKVLVPKHRLTRQDCTPFPSGYSILVSDESGDNPDGVIYEGTVDSSVIKHGSGEPQVLFRCLPAELETD